ncbi:MAG: hypothetical protein N3D75_02995 [Candidatus Aenigmarchaeota archaeon]|nr:hypothetical protein [Candidatus Aenigmarchaeota archaeon]
MPTIGIKEISLVILFFWTNVVQAVDLSEDMLFYYQIHTFQSKAVVYPKQQDIKLGVSSETTIIDFGEIYEKMGSRKYINITGNSFDHKVKLYAEGNISKFLIFEKNNFILEKNQVTSIPIYFSGDTPGTYEGEIKVVFKRIKYPILNWLLKCA